jgi:hypothetical protein
MRLIIFAVGGMYTIHDMKNEFVNFLEEHGVHGEPTHTAVGGQTLLFYEDMFYCLFNLPPKAQWQQFIKEPADFPAGSAIRFLRERKEARETAQKRCDGERK